MSEDHYLLETTQSETVPLLSDDVYLGGSASRRRARRGLRYRGRSVTVVGQRFGTLLSVMCPFYTQATSGEYTGKKLASDLLTGLTMSVFHIPQGLAYGLLAGLRPINGLYTSLIPVAVYCLFGRSRHLSLGTFSLTSLLLAGMIESCYRRYILDRLGSVNETFDDNSTTAWGNVNETTDLELRQDQTFGKLSTEEYARLQVAILGSLSASLINMVLGILHLGFVMRYVSSPMLRGFTTAAAVYIFTSQLPVLLGISPTPRDSFFKLVSSYTGIVNAIGSTNLATVMTSATCIVPLYLIKEHLNPRMEKLIKLTLPAELLVILMSLAASHAIQLSPKYGVAVVGPVPKGLPKPLVPDLAFLPNVVVDSLPVSLVSGVVSLSIVKMYALQFDYSVNYNGELFVLGASSLFGSFFQCFYASGALARCTVVVGAGMQSQVASAVSCLVLLLVVLIVGPLFELVPNSALAAIIVVSLVSLFKQVVDMPRLWRAAKYLDLSVWLISAVAVLILGLSIGLAVGFGYSLMCNLATQIVEATHRRRKRGGRISATAADLADAAVRYPMMIGPRRQ